MPREVVNNRNQRPSGIYCTVCGKNGHLGRHCYRLRHKRRNQRGVTRRQQMHKQQADGSLSQTGTQPTQPPALIQTQVQPPAPPPAQNTNQMVAETITTTVTVRQYQPSVRAAQTIQPCTVQNRLGYRGVAPITSGRGRGGNYRSRGYQGGRGRGGFRGRGGRGFSGRGGRGGQTNYNY